MGWQSKNSSEIGKKKELTFIQSDIELSYRAAIYADGKQGVPVFRSVE